MLKNLLILIIICSVTTVSLIVLRNSSGTARTKSVIISPLAISSIAPSTFPRMSPRKSRNELDKVVKNSLKSSRTEYGIAIENLATGESYYLNEHQKFDTGSLYKLWVMAETFNQIQNGHITFDDILNQDIGILNEKFDIGPQEAELTEGTITLSVKEALNKMIAISDNYSALLLSEKVKLTNVAALMEKSGFGESNLGEPPQTTAYDIALFFEKLYQGELIDEKNSLDMINLLKQQKIETKLAKYLPVSTVFAHKTGEIGYFSHDGGIVFTKAGDYIIIVLTRSDNPLEENGRIAQLSKNVFDYFQNE